MQFSATLKCCDVCDLSISVFITWLHKEESSLRANFIQTEICRAPCVHVIRVGHNHLPSQYGHVHSFVHTPHLSITLWFSVIRSEEISLDRNSFQAKIRKRSLALVLWRTTIGEDDQFWKCYPFSLQVLYRVLEEMVYSVIVVVVVVAEEYQGVPHNQIRNIGRVIEDYNRVDCYLSSSEEHRLGLVLVSDGSIFAEVQCKQDTVCGQVFLHFCKLPLLPLPNKQVFAKAGALHRRINITLKLLNHVWYPFSLALKDSSCLPILNHSLPVIPSHHCVFFFCPEVVS